MGCTRPLKAWRSRVRGKTGRLGLTFRKEEAATGTSIDIPCGQCIGCRLERSRQWAVRCMHEAACHDVNCFVTLTYSDEHLPSDGGLRKRDFQLFMKRLRKLTGGGVRYYQCGEYGEKNGRPHYHACLFGWRPGPQESEQVGGSGDYKLYRADVLDDLWGLGLCVFGNLVFQSAAYVSAYVTKKQTGKGASKYATVDEETGEYSEVLPPYSSMSLRPAIGADWLKRHGREVYPSDSVVMNGSEMLPPKYYDRKLELEDPELFEKIKERRLERSKDRDTSSGRMFGRDRFVSGKFKSYSRGKV